MISLQEAKIKNLKNIQSYINQIENLIDKKIVDNYDDLVKGRSVGVTQIDPKYKIHLERLFKKYAEFEFYMDAYEYDPCNLTVSLKR